MLDEPIDDGHGGEITERVAEVSWTGGPLPESDMAEFGLAVLLPEGEPGTKVYFPTVQECEEGEHAWVQIPEEGEDGHDLDEPAPAVTLTAAGGGAHGPADDEEVTGEGEPGDPGTGESGTVALDDAELGSGEASPGGDGGTDALAVVALVAALVALAVGAAALVRGRPAGAR